MDNFQEEMLLRELIESSASGNESEEEMLLRELIESSASGNEFILGMFFEEHTSLEDSTEDKKHATVDSFIMTIESFSEEDFKSHFRLRRSTIERLITSYSQHYLSLHAVNRGGRIKIGCRKEVFMYIWYISNTVTFRQLANLFGVTKSSSWVVVNRVCKWLVSKGQDYIKWPQGNAVTENCRKFEEKKRIPGVLGAIDCTHITIVAPKIDKVCYYNRKHKFTIILQAVVDADKKFIDISCGEPGSLHDSRVLRRSQLFKKALSHTNQLFPANSFIFGDSAYAASNWLVPPYKDNGRLTEQQRTFNYVHSATRIVVEHAFGLLKGRFRRLLKFTEQRDIRSVTNLVVSACILHNLCIAMGDTYNDEGISQEEETDTIDAAESTSNPTTNRRQILFEYLREHNII
ncbi:uncharacterized protein LOC129940385 [Eupeodes corollae]|uniref:uncharacterized protein LOC129940385 n=1 Tax=Eupeodes corollae TaxID=290404 RepID=UPI0024937423|nr:uncharacterized protein LOC129940385 [Eupeodes corollae]